MKLEFIVRGMKTKYPDHLELEIKKVEKPPEPSKPEKEVEVTPIVDPLEAFKPKTKEEKIARGILVALRAMGAFPEPQPPPPGGLSRPPRFCVAHTPMTLTLSDKEYAELGRPGIGAKITMNLEVKKDD